MERIFYLSSDPVLVKDQIYGESVGENQMMDLAKDVSTDAIFPTRGVTASYQELAPFALSGFKQIAEGDLEKLRPEVLVVGNGFGTGSSREHASISLKQAGVRKIVCVGGRVERIFLENCLMNGIEVFEYPHLVNVLSEIEVVLKEDKCNRVYNDRLRPDIARVGGMSIYTRMRAEGRVEPTRVCHNNVGKDYPMTAVQKILSRKMVNVRPNVHGEWVVFPGDTGFVSLDYRMSYELHTTIVDSILENELVGLNIVKPEHVHLFQDHSALYTLIDRRYGKLIDLQKELAQKYGFNLHGSLREGGLTEGICHTLSVEKSLILPGEAGIGTDSHTCSLGVLNSLSWGIGATHFANTLVLGEALVEVPQTVKIELIGRLRNEVTPKDLMLYILSQDFVKDGSSTNTVFEYDGWGLDEMTLSDQMVLTNMAVEGRAMTGIITRLTPALYEHLMLSKNMTRREVEKIFVSSDQGASFSKIIKIDLDDVEPMVALPGDPRNGTPLSEMRQRRVKDVYIGSCTGGNLEDLEMVARVLKGKHVVDGVRMYIQAASLSILNEARRLGYIDVFRTAGAEVVGLGCGACIGLGPGRVDDEEEGDRNEVVVSNTNRNYPKRMGGDMPVILTSAITAANAAVSGILGARCT